MATQRKTRSSTAAQSKQANGVSSSAGKVSSSKAAGGSKVAASKDDDSVFHEYEFGGPIGTLAMMIVFPALFYYFYVCLYFHDGAFAFCSRREHQTDALSAVDMQARCLGRTTRSRLRAGLSLPSMFISPPSR